MTRSIGVPIDLIHGRSPWRANMPFGERETDAWRGVKEAPAPPPAPSPAPPPAPSPAPTPSPAPGP